MALALILTSDHESHKVATAALACTAGVSFIAAGLIALYRRPENRTGVYLAARRLPVVPRRADRGRTTTGSSRSGIWLGNLAFIPFAALVLAYPTGRLAPRPDQLLVRLTAAFVLIGPPLLLLFAKHPPAAAASAASSAVVIVESPRPRSSSTRSAPPSRSALVIAVVAVLVRRWRRATPALRRTLLPVYLAGGGTLVVAARRATSLAQISTAAADALGPLFLVFFAAVPFAFLFGILRSRLARGSVGSARRLDRPGRAAARRDRGGARRSRRSSSPSGSTRSSASSTATAAPSSCPSRAPAASPRSSSATAGRSARSCTTSRCATSPS